MFGAPLHTTDNRIIEEGEIVAKEIDYFSDAVGLFLAIIFIFNSEYNCANTFGFLQKAILDVDTCLSHGIFYPKHNLVLLTSQN